MDLDFEKGCLGEGVGWECVYGCMGVYAYVYYVDR